ALTELVANAYDAGSSRVDITVPSDYEGALVVEDNGIGMTQQDINDRWLKLRYNRLLHQGEKVEFPIEKENYSRKAFGKNGIGRHALFCFADEYILDTWKSDNQNILTISVGKYEPIKVNAFVVGHAIKSKTSTTKSVSDDNAEIGKVVAVTFSSLIATAEARLFRLRDKLRERYDSYPTEDLQKEILGL
ncbi:MAG: ATP-binding protein, partial [Thiotrichales bacterium]|nr:ATP-binding protein [Thiotrichales bacterium]